MKAGSRVPWRGMQEGIFTQTRLPRALQQRDTAQVQRQGRGGQLLLRLLHLGSGDHSCCDPSPGAWRSAAFCASAGAQGQLATARSFARMNEKLSAGRPGDPKKPFRVVEITMQESYGRLFYQPNTLEVKRGQQIKFVITNVGLLAHEFILANTADVGPAERSGFVSA